jgi:hypothetical protein
MATALAAERRGDLAMAADGFFRMLRDHPQDQQAILGLSRVLPALERRSELMAPLAAVLRTDSTNTRLLALAVRNWTLLGQPDSAARYADRWATLSEGDEEPFREWALSALEIRDRAAAKRALETGRARIAHPAALAPELAQLHQAEGDMAGAAEEWLRAVTNAPTYRASAVLLLGAALPPDRPGVLAALDRAGTPEAHRLHGLLRLVWGDPEGGVAELATVVPTSVEGTTVMVRLVADQLKNRNDPPARRAAAQAYEILASQQSGEARVTSWITAARAWADGGAEARARDLLARIAADPAAPDGVAVSASETLLGVLLSEGSIDAADSLFRRLEPALTLDQRDHDRRRIARGWAMRGAVERAHAIVAHDSSVAGFDVRGRVDALAGNLGVAAEWLRLAGPYDDERLQAVERVRLLTLIKAVATDTLLGFGLALRSLERGDTALASLAFGNLADSVAPAGAAALHLFAADLAFARGDTSRALTMATAADVAGADSAATADATAPAARILRARIIAARGDPVAAVALLESLILDFPESAVVPEARRMRDLLRGAVPTGSAP